MVGNQGGGEVEKGIVRRRRRQYIHSNPLIVYYNIILYIIAPLPLCGDAGREDGGDGT